MKNNFFVSFISLTSLCKGFNIKYDKVFFALFCIELRWTLFKLVIRVSSYKTEDPRIKGIIESHKTTLLVHVFIKSQFRRKLYWLRLCNCSNSFSTNALPVLWFPVAKQQLLGSLSTTKIYQCLCFQHLAISQKIGIFFLQILIKTAPESADNVYEKCSKNCCKILVIYLDLKAQ